MSLSWNGNLQKLLVATVVVVTFVVANLFVFGTDDVEFSVVFVFVFVFVAFVAFVVFVVIVSGLDVVTSFVVVVSVVVVLVVVVVVVVDASMAHRR